MRKLYYSRAIPVMTGKMATENGHRPRTFPTMTAKIVDVAIVVTLPKASLYTSWGIQTAIFDDLHDRTCERYGISSPF